jgi:hypothetical protein
LGDDRLLACDCGHRGGTGMAAVRAARKSAATWLPKTKPAGQRLRLL